MSITRDKVYMMAGTLDRLEINERLATRLGSSSHSDSTKVKFILETLSKRQILNAVSDYLVDEIIQLEAELRDLGVDIEA